MSFLIERVGPAIAPHTSTLIEQLPVLWQDSEAHNLMRSAIVSTLVYLVKVR